MSTPSPARSPTDSRIAEVDRQHGSSWVRAVGQKAHRRALNRPAGLLRSEAGRPARASHPQRMLNQLPQTAPRLPQPKGPRVLRRRRLPNPRGARGRPVASTIHRQIPDGTPYRLVKVPHQPADLERRLRQLGWHIKVTSTAGPFYWGRKPRQAPHIGRRVCYAPDGVALGGDHGHARTGQHGRCCICLVRGMLRPRRGLASDRQGQLVNATATRRVTGSSTASSYALVGRSARRRARRLRSWRCGPA